MTLEIGTSEPAGHIGERDGVVGECDPRRERRRNGLAKPSAREHPR
jgi:hypothetical protein